MMYLIKVAKHTNVSKIYADPFIFSEHLCFIKTDDCVEEIRRKLDIGVPGTGGVNTCVLECFGTGEEYYHTGRDCIRAETLYSILRESQQRIAHNDMLLPRKRVNAVSTNILEMFSERDRDEYLVGMNKYLTSVGEVEKIGRRYLLLRDIYVDIGLLLEDVYGFTSTRRPPGRLLEGFQLDCEEEIFFTERDMRNWVVHVPMKPSNKLEPPARRTVIGSRSDEDWSDLLYEMAFLEKKLTGINEEGGQNGK